MKRRNYTNVKELVGTVYNDFMFIDYKREKGRSFLFAECPHCHNRKWMRKESVEIAKSCGCLNYETQFKAKNIKGKRFGRLVALEPTEIRDKNNDSVVWRCRCDCGNNADVAEYLLSNGRVKSCGCFGRENSAINGKNLVQSRWKKYASKTQGWII